jgi:glycyl-tRNA synthetase (class II)
VQRLPSERPKHAVTLETCIEINKYKIQYCNIVVSSGKFNNFNDTLVGQKICNSAKNFT